MDLIRDLYTNTAIALHTESVVSDWYARKWSITGLQTCPRPVFANGPNHGADCWWRSHRRSQWMFSDLELPGQDLELPGPGVAHDVTLLAETLMSLVLSYTLLCSFMLLMLSTAVLSFAFLLAVRRSNFRVVSPFSTTLVQVLLGQSSCLLHSLGAYSQMSRALSSVFIFPEPVKYTWKSSLHSVLWQGLVLLPFSPDCHVTDLVHVGNLLDPPEAQHIKALKLFIYSLCGRTSLAAVEVHYQHIWLIQLQLGIQLRHWAPNTRSWSLHWKY